MEPIFIGATRSFWYALTAAVTFLGMGEPVFTAVATVIVAFGDVACAAGTTAACGVDEAPIVAWLVKIAPLALIAGALFERRGENRPYTINPKALK